jgi:uncharacterized membrane protein HdeD (DUF308 family)
LSTSAVSRGGGLWWVWLVAGTAWIVVALVVLQFDSASVKTTGVIIGCQFLVAGAQEIFLGVATDGRRWPSVLMGVLLLIAGVISIVNPAETVAGLADVLGFLFLLVGLYWTVEALVVRDANPVWWLSLISGIVMIVVAFWTSGQFLMDKTYLLLVFAGIWALAHGITDIVRAFTVRGARR